MYHTILLLILCSLSHNSYAQFSTFYDDYYEQNKRQYTFETEEQIDQFFNQNIDGSYMTGLTKTYTNITKNKKDVMYILGAGEQDSFYIFYYDKDEELYTLVTSANYSNVYFSPRNKTITYTQTGCCGESVFQGNIVLQLDEDGAHQLENYAIVTLNIPESDIQIAEIYNLPKWGIVQNEDYNFRIYPSMGNKYPESDTFFTIFSDNLLGKIKKNSKIKLIGQRSAEDRTWYYVEVDPENLSVNHTEGSTHNSYQNIRGWVSSNFITLSPQ